MDEQEEAPPSPGAPAKSTGSQDPKQAEEVQEVDARAGEEAQRDVKEADLHKAEASSSQARARKQCGFLFAALRPPVQKKRMCTLQAYSAVAMKVYTVTSGAVEC